MSGWTERTIAAPGAEIASEALGDPADPPVLLVMGATASRLAWPEGFCAGLAARGRFVIRHDSRDTGRSSHWPPGAPGYGLADLAADAAAVIAGWGHESAHVAGVSMGGFVGQILALTRPERVGSLAVLGSGSVEPAPEGAEEPGIDPEALAHLAMQAGLDWSDRAAVVAWMTGTWRHCTRRRPFDEAGYAALSAAEYDRARDIRSAFNHALLEADAPVLPPLATLAAPLLVIHGTLDPILPFAGAERLAASVPGARLLALDGAGHELHPDDWPAILDALEAHTAG